MAPTRPPAPHFGLTGAPAFRPKRQSAPRKGSRAGDITLLDRVAEDFNRSSYFAVTLNIFTGVADIWTPVGLPLAGSVQVMARPRARRPVGHDPARSSPQSLGTSPFPRWPSIRQTIWGAGFVRKSAARCGRDWLVYFAADARGADTLTELRQSFAWPKAECEGAGRPSPARGAPFADLRDVGGLLGKQARPGPLAPAGDRCRWVVVRYEQTAFALMADLRRMGATKHTSPRAGRSWRRPRARGRLLRMAEILRREVLADPDGAGIRADVSILILDVRLGGRMEPARKPLKPGSANG